MSGIPRDDWWRRFFEDVDSLDLSCFPGEQETAQEVLGLVRMLGLTTQDRIADVCCGWGRHLGPLVRMGHRVTGLDASAMMLGYARALLEHEGLAAPLVRGDAAALPYRDGSFDVVLNLFNSFGYFLEEGQNLRVLEEASRVLRPGGRFYLDTRNRPFQILFAPHAQPVTTWDGKEYVLRCSYDRQGRRLDSRWSLPEDPETVVHEASIRLYGLEELRLLLGHAGFEEVAVFGTYEGEAFDGYHRQLLYVGRKRG